MPVSLPQDPQKPATVDNLVLLTHAEADDHDQLQSLDALRQQVRGGAAAVVAGEAGMVGQPSAIVQGLQP